MSALSIDVGQTFESVEPDDESWARTEYPVMTEPPEFVGAVHVTVTDDGPLVAVPIVGAPVTVARADDHASVIACGEVAVFDPIATQEVPVGQLTPRKLPPPELSGITSVELDHFQIPPVATPVAMTGIPLLSPPTALHEVVVAQLTPTRLAPASSPAIGVAGVHVQELPELVPIEYAAYPDKAPTAMHMVALGQLSALNSESGLSFAPGWREVHVQLPPDSVPEE